MSRIKSTNIQLGSHYVLGKKTVQTELTDEEKGLLQQYKQQAENALQQAQLTAQNILNEAQLKAQEALSQAQQEGFQAGYNEGLQKGYKEGANNISQELVNQINSVNIIASSTLDIKNEILKASEKEIVELAIAIAEKITSTKLELSQDILINITTSAIKQLKDKEEVLISINPKISEHLYNSFDELKQEIKGLSNLKIIDDRTISADGVIVESLDTRIDARLKTQIEEITKSLLKEVEENPVLKDMENITKTIKAAKAKKVATENNEEDNLKPKPRAKAKTPTKKVDEEK